jgi:hypothetical protein
MVWRERGLLIRELVLRTLQLAVISAADSGERCFGARLEGFLKAAIHQKEHVRQLLTKL